MKGRPDDQCPQPDALPSTPTRPLATPIYPTSVWQCESPDQAEQMLDGKLAGYVYQRDAHPNAEALAAKCCQLHGAQHAVITSSGMAALSAAVLSQLQAGDHLLVSRELYGRSLQLLTEQCLKLAIEHTLFDPCQPDSMANDFRPNTRLVVVETLSNPTLKVADLCSLAELTHRHDAQLLVDNTFATPVLCRPLELGADLVMESISKMMNGHSDVMLGLLCGNESSWEQVPATVSIWGLASGPFDCWLATRGLATLPLRLARACDCASTVAEWLQTQETIERVDYPGLAAHPQHTLAKRQLGGQFGTVVTFHLKGGRDTAEQFVRQTRNQLPFCPSLGETVTTLSHPESTSHRGLSATQRATLGIQGGTIRLSVGIESTEHVVDCLEAGLTGL
ncbi:MAG: hypothetical protein CMJ59_02720 [Planctomycetaceae bacterium]|nr:hypothetical protein [Planctomycetaceae bacterium]